MGENLTGGFQIGYWSADGFGVVWRRGAPGILRVRGDSDWQEDNSSCLRSERWRGSIYFVFRKVISLSSCGQGRQSKLGQGYDIYMEGQSVDLVEVTFFE